MSYACHGSSSATGMVLAEERDSRTCRSVEDPLDAGKQVILERGWAEDVLFTEHWRASSRID